MSKNKDNIYDRFMEALYKVIDIEHRNMCLYSIYINSLKLNHAIRIDRNTVFLYNEAYDKVMVFDIYLNRDINKLSDLFNVFKPKIIYIPNYNNVYSIIRELGKNKQITIQNNIILKFKDSIVVEIEGYEEGILYSKTYIMMGFPSCKVYQIDIGIPEKKTIFKNNSIKYDTIMMLFHDETYKIMYNMKAYTYIMENIPNIFKIIETMDKLLIYMIA